MMKLLNIFAIVILLAIATLGDCIEITKVKVDSPMISGKNGWLKCDWNSKGDVLYSIKWYWGVNEFYRWSPNAETPILIFNVSAFDVDPIKSNKGHVFVRNISLKANGILRCEVSGEGPYFNTDTQDVHLEVVDFPDNKPIIAGSRSVYELHQTVALTCTSPRAKPAAMLYFYINNEKAESIWLVRHPIQLEDNGLETSVLGLRFPLQPRLVQDDGKIAIKCTARIGDLYWESSDKNIYVAGAVPQRASRMEERATGSASIGCHFSLGFYSFWAVTCLYVRHIMKLLL